MLLERLRRLFFEALPRYEWLSTLGQGGMGVVFKARDKDLDETVAIKVLSPSVEMEAGEALGRFKRELSLNRRIKHPNVARLYDFGTSGDFVYITMEFIAGQDLRCRMDAAGRLPASTVVPVLRQAALGMHAAHALGIVHRDLSPQNVMVDDQGGVAILDFGIARGLVHPRLTGGGRVWGTPEYMSPEQVLDQGVDGRSDLYALGAIAFEALSGSVPFTGASFVEVALLHLNKPAPLDRLRDVPGVPERLVEVIGRCLAKKADDRFQTAEELEGALHLVPIEADAAQTSPLPAAAVALIDSGTRPAAPPPEPSPSASAPAVGPVDREAEVLLVDDDSTLRALYAMRLTMAGCRVVECEDGESALAALGAASYDLVLMDVQMPGLDGFDATRILRTQERFRDLPVLLMSAYFDRNRIAFGLQAGATEILEKPLPPDALARRVWAVLTRRGFVSPLSVEPEAG